MEWKNGKMEEWGIKLNKRRGGGGRAGGRKTGGVIQRSCVIQSFCAGLG
jgi:hypothetical protein